MRATFALAVLLSLASCHRERPAPDKPGEHVVPAGGQGRDTEPRVSARPNGAPVETAPPNTELRPAFAGQTRAPAIKSDTQLEVVELASGFDHPWALAFLPDRRMLVTEKPTGKLFIVSPDGKKSPAVTGLPRVDGREQGGLLDVALDPHFEDNHLIYWSYYEPRKGGNGLAVARAELLDGAAPSTRGLAVIFRMEPTLDSTKHAGGRLVFTPDQQFLFITLGERSILQGRMQARELGSHLGKIVRIRPDGSIPQDNPFVSQQGARPEIWSRGHRNVLAAAFDDRGRLWETEMGPQGGDELNLIERGQDYGWPTIGYGEEYSGKPIHASSQAPGLEQPVYYWDPVISPSSMLIYSGSLFPEWKGSFLIGGLSSSALIRLTLRDDRVTGEERLLADYGARIREVVQGPDGALYLLTDASDGKLLKLSPRR